MNKQSMKELCEMNDRAFDHGVISAGGASNRKIHLTKGKFEELFSEYEVTEFDNEYDRWCVMEDGFEFFCLVEF